MSDPFGRLQQWYASQCDGDWEHQYGVTIETLDNPGWRLSVDLDDTAWEALDVASVGEGDSDSDGPWLMYAVKERRFEGACSPTRLHELVVAFLRLVES